MMVYQFRKAALTDRPALEALIGRSIRVLGADDYTPAQIEAALKGAFGVDTQLIDDGTYYLVEDEGRPVACGGWSYRQTLFGGDGHMQRDAAKLDPRLEAAKIRAFFVDPAHARRGLGTQILDRCEADAVAAGFRKLELMATLPGVRLYAVRGYVPGTAVRYSLAPDLDIEFVPMTKESGLR